MSGHVNRLAALILRKPEAELIAHLLAIIDIIIASKRAGMAPNRP